MARPFFFMPRNPYDTIIEDAEATARGQMMGTDIFSQFLNPGRQEVVEFGQQVALQKMQNDYNSAPNQMELMKKAGINANVAAAGIAGAGNAPSAGSPNSAIGAGSQGVGAAAQAAEAANNAVNAGVNAYEKVSLTGVEREKRKAEIRDLLAAATHNEWLAYAVSEMLPEQKRETQANTYLKLAQYANAKEEFFNIQKEYEVKEAEVKRLKAERDLAVQQKNYVAAEQLKVEAETAGIELDNWKKNRDKEWYEKYGYDRNNPVDNILIDGMISGNDEVVTAVGESVKLSTYSERKGFNQAEVEDGFDKAFNAGLGDQASAAEYAEYRYEIDVAKMAVAAYLEALASGDDNPAKFVIQKLMAGSLKGEADERKRDVGNKPNPQPRIR